MLSMYTKPDIVNPVDLMSSLLLMYFIPKCIKKVWNLVHDYLSRQSSAYKKKQENRRNIRKAKVAKEIGITAQDLESYTLCFVGIDQLTSSDEERTILNR